MMNSCDRKIKASTILGHWQMYVIRVHILPFKRQSFRFPKPGEYLIVVDGRPDEDLFALEHVRTTFVDGRRMHG